MYKVFINEKPICFTNDRSEYTQFSNLLVLKYYDAGALQPILNLLTSDINIEAVVFDSKDLEQAFQSFSSRFKRIDAAGGVVINDRNEKLFIFRNNKWDLPKGKIEPKESLSEAAVREVTEECGVDHLRVNRELKDTFHLYTEEGKLILKRTKWFEMHTDYKGKLKPQHDEGISKAVWFFEDQINNKVMGNTYASIKDFLFLNGYLSNRKEPSPDSVL